MAFIKGTPSGKTLIEKAANFIIPFEGFRSRAYWDFKQYSYGYGSAAPSATSTIDEVTAKSLLMSILANNLGFIENYLKRPVTENQLIALLSFDYNLGFGNTKNILDRINKDLSIEEVTNAMKLYVNAGGKPLQALIDRRAKEVKLFKS